MFFRIDDLYQREILPGIRMRSVAGEGSMMTFFDFEPGAIVPEHQHPHQQISVMIKGRAIFQLGEETREIGPGEGVVIPSEVSHAVTIQDDPAVIWDLWVPIREDYLNP